jgi:hypothetical protein
VTVNGSVARREHMQQRARERFGVEIGKLARRSLIRKVQSGEVHYARKLSHSRTVIVADYAGMEVTFIYCGRTKSILTFLPAEARETAAWRECRSPLSSLSCDIRP